ncbi:MAG: AbrB/MazE/SpoVT family DNA-binding domain-containing protein [Bacteroidetes bacterium]|nr:AbrB/MazE/SpoVT family DNA-binding domain-containing protein [Bacteroidota bacterium]
MTTTILSTRGRVVIPKEVRDRLGWKPGQEVEILDTDKGVLVRPVGKGMECSSPTVSDPAEPN